MPAGPQDNITAQRLVKRFTRSAWVMLGANKSSSFSHAQTQPLTAKPGAALHGSHNLNRQNQRLPKRLSSLNSWVVPGSHCKTGSWKCYRKCYRQLAKNPPCPAFTHSNVCLDNLSSPWINLPGSAESPWIHRVLMDMMDMIGYDWIVDLCRSM